MKPNGFLWVVYCLPIFILTVLLHSSCGTDTKEEDWEVIASELYGNCDGTPFWPECDDLSCIETDEEQQYFELFHEALLARLGGSENYLRDHIFINDVTIIPHHDNRIFRVDFLFVYNWVRIRRSVEVRTLDPFSQDRFLEQLNEPGAGFSLDGKPSKPINFDVMNQAIAECSGTTDYRGWCGSLGIGKYSGELIFSDWVAVLSLETNACKCLEWNLENNEGECTYCRCGDY